MGMGRGDERGGGGGGVSGEGGGRVNGEKGGGEDLEEVLEARQGDRGGW